MTPGSAAPGVPPVELRTRFERFPASVKGAFVMQGADGNPHTVRLEGASVARIPSGPEKPVPTGAIHVSVAPNRDLFVPFEASLTDLEPGWYSIRSTIQVDAGRSYVFHSRAFSVAWPRSQVRRATLPVGRSLRVGAMEVRIERVELGTDATIVVWAAGARPSSRRRATAEEGPPTEAEVVLAVDEAPLEVLPGDLVRLPPGRVGPSERRTVAYPVPRSARSLSLSVRIPTGEESVAIRLRLD